MLPQTERDIGSKRYRVTALPTEEGLQTLPKVAKLFGPSVAAVLRTLQAPEGKTLAEADIGGPAMADALVELCERVDGTSLIELFRTFAARTDVMVEHGFIPLEKAPGGIYGAFSADYGSLFRLVSLHVEHNYASFLADLIGTVRPK